VGFALALIGHLVLGVAPAWRGVSWRALKDWAAYPIPLEELQDEPALGYGAGASRDACSTSCTAVAVD
jgi:hypothetical protein